MTRSRQTLLVAVASLLLTSCGERLVYEADPDSVVTAEDTTTTLDRSLTDENQSSDTVTIGTDSIDWQSCSNAFSEGSFECGTLVVPFDYDDPAAGTFTLSLVRRLAENPSLRLGSLLVNPGGPGFGGTSVAEQAEWYLSSSLLERFDVVGWDPRGTGNSTPAVDCIDNYDRYFGIDSPPNDDAAKREMISLTQEFVDACVTRSGEMLKYISTEASARDIDSIRRALGEERISYFGFSYGSELGAAWVTLFPNSVRAAVFDGASDPNANGFDQAMSQLKGFEQQLNAFFADCTKRPSCAIYNDGQPAALFDELVKQIDAQPIPTTDGRTPVTQGVFYTAVVQAMYSDTMWSQLEVALAQAARGNGTGLLQLYDGYYRRQPDGTYGNELEAFLAISCLDGSDGATVAEVEADVRRFAVAAKRLGENFGYGYACALWPYRVDQRLQITGRGAGPIVVVGTTGDAATPLVSTRKAAAALERGVLIVVEADRHTGYGLNSCVVERVDDYLIDLTVPENETYCR